MRKTAQGNLDLGYLTNILGQAKKLFGNRPIKEDGETTGNIPSTVRPAAGYTEHRLQELLGQSDLSDLRKDQTRIYFDTIKEALVQSGLVDEQNAEAAVANLPPFVIQWLGNQTGYGEALNNVEKMVIQGGYQDPSLKDTPSAKRAQKKRNENLMALSKSLFAYLRPDNVTKGKYPIPDIDPGRFSREIMQNWDIMEEVIKNPQLTNSKGNLTDKGNQIVHNRLDQLADGIRELRYITGQQNLDAAKQAGQNLFGTRRNPLKITMDKNVQEKLQQYHKRAQDLGFTTGEKQALLKQQIRNAANPEQGISSAIGQIGAYSPEVMGSFEDPEDRKAYFEAIGSRASKPQDYKPTKLEASAYNFLKSHGYGDKSSKDLIRQAREYARNPYSEFKSTPEGSMQSLNYLTPDDVNFSPEDYTKYLYATDEMDSFDPGALDYLNSVDASRSAVEWANEQADYHIKEQLRKEFGKKNAELISRYTGGKIPTEKDLENIPYYTGYDDPEQRRSFLSRARKAIGRGAKRMGTTPEAARHVAQAELPSRISRTMDKYDKLRQYTPTGRPSGGSESFIQNILRGKGKKDNVPFIRNILQSWAQKGRPIQTGKIQNNLNLPKITNEKI